MGRYVYQPMSYHEYLTKFINSLKTGELLVNLPDHDIYVTEEGFNVPIPVISSMRRVIIDYLENDPEGIKTRMRFTPIMLDKLIRIKSEMEEEQQDIYNKIINLYTLENEIRNKYLFISKITEYNINQLGDINIDLDHIASSLDSYSKEIAELVLLFNKTNFDCGNYERINTENNLELHRLWNIIGRLYDEMNKKINKFKSIDGSFQIYSFVTKSMSIYDVDWNRRLNRFYEGCEDIYSPRTGLPFVGVDERYEYYIDHSTGTNYAGCKYTADEWNKNDYINLCMDITSRYSYFITQHSPLQWGNLTLPGYSTYQGSSIFYPGFTNKINLTTKDKGTYHYYPYDCFEGLGLTVCRNKLIPSNTNQETRKVYPYPDKGSGPGFPIDSGRYNETYAVTKKVGKSNTNVYGYGSAIYQSLMLDSTNEANIKAFSGIYNGNCEKAHYVYKPFLRGEYRNFDPNSSNGEYGPDGSGGRVKGYTGYIGYNNLDNCIEYIRGPWNNILPYIYRGYYSFDSNGFAYEVKASDTPSMSHTSAYNNYTSWGKPLNIYNNTYKFDHTAYTDGTLGYPNTDSNLQYFAPDQLLPKYLCGIANRTPNDGDNDRLFSNIGGNGHANSPYYYDSNAKRAKLVAEGNNLNKGFPKNAYTNSSFQIFSGALPTISRVVTQPWAGYGGQYYLASSGTMNSDAIIFRMGVQKQFNVTAIGAHVDMKYYNDTGWKVKS